MTSIWLMSADCCATQTILKKKQKTGTFSHCGFHYKWHPCVSIVQICFLIVFLCSFIWLINYFNSKMMNISAEWKLMFSYFFLILRSMAVCRHESGRRRSFLPWLAIFFIFYLSVCPFYITINFHGAQMPSLLSYIVIFKCLLLWGTFH